MFRIKRIVVALPEYSLFYYATVVAFWTLIASLVVRWALLGFAYPYCPADTLYGFLEVSCDGFLFADIIRGALQFFANVIVGSLFAIALTGVALANLAQGQVFLYIDQQTVWTTLGTITLGMAAIAFYLLALLYVMYFVGLLWRRATQRKNG